MYSMYIPLSYWELWILCKREIPNHEKWGVGQMLFSLDRVLACPPLPPTCTITNLSPVLSLSLHVHQLIGVMNRGLLGWVPSGTGALCECVWPDPWWKSTHTHMKKHQSCDYDAMVDWSASTHIRVPSMLQLLFLCKVLELVRHSSERDRERVRERTLKLVPFISKSG